MLLGFLVFVLGVIAIIFNIMCAGVKEGAYRGYMYNRSKAAISEDIGLYMKYYSDISNKKIEPLCAKKYVEKAMKEIGIEKKRDEAFNDQRERNLMAKNPGTIAAIIMAKDGKCPPSINMSYEITGIKCFGYDEDWYHCPYDGMFDGNGKGKLLSWIGKEMRNKNENFHIYVTDKNNYNGTIRYFSGGKVSGMVEL